jgi:glycolate oxidase
MEEGAELIARARLICGEQHVLTNPVVLSTYRSDGLRRDGPLPLAAVLPGSASEVASVVGACGDAQIAYVVRGAGTSRRGGALPIAHGLLIVLTRLRRIIEVTGTELTVEAGVPLVALPACRSGTWLDGIEQLGTVGGHIAETAEVGNVVALDLVRPDGTALHLNSSFPGYDVAGAFAGSGGQAGIAVRVTLRAVSRP